MASSAEGTTPPTASKSGHSFLPAQLLAGAMMGADHFPLGVSGSPGKVGLGLPGFKCWDSMWTTKGVSNTPLLTCHSLCVCVALLIFFFFRIN